uniref:Transmembrane 9 superfamily member n=1 Tax=Lepisosteus oculatus TaxID=7918 RepID=W5LYE8_LEPOC
MIRLGLRLAGGGLWACLLSCWVLPSGGGAATYKQGDPVTLYVNKVGPYHNPQETYHYYTLPVCRPKEVRHKALSLGEVLDGDRMAESLYEIRFRENAERKALCELTLTEKEVRGPLAGSPSRPSPSLSSSVAAFVSVKKTPKQNVEEEGGCDDLDQGDNGWKIIHTDVFRFPSCKSLLCAVLGVGAQFLTLATGIIVMALLGMFNVHRHGAINSAAIALYALTSCVSGFVSSHFYRQIEGQRWVWNIILTSSLFS